MAKFKIMGVILFFILPLFSLGFAEEESFTISTYYASPYGSYSELSTASNTYLATSPGNVGVGTDTPQAKLEIAGDIKISQAGEVVNLRAENRSGQPNFTTSAEKESNKGRIIFDTRDAEKRLYFYDGNGWKKM